MSRTSAGPCAMLDEALTKLHSLMQSIRNNEAPVALAAHEEVLLPERLLCHRMESSRGPSEEGSSRRGRS